MCLLSYGILLHIDHITDFRPPAEGSVDWLNAIRSAGI
jgi:hypothetical protein